MSTITERKVIRIELEHREAFLLNALYAIGLRVVAGDHPTALVDSVRRVAQGPHAAAALYSVSDKMRSSALSISKADHDQMAVDP